jgi:hypothetical protein
MSSSQAFRWERVSDQTRFQRDPTLAIPAEVTGLLTEGALAPHRIHQERGVYWYFGHVLATTKKDKRNPKTRLKLWTEADGLIAIDESWPIGPEATFDLDRRRALVASASDEARTIGALFEIDLNTRKRRQLEIVNPGDITGWSGAFYLSDGGIAARWRTRLHVFHRDGDRLTLAPFDMEIGEFFYVGVAGRFAVTPAAIWDVDSTGIRQVAEFPGVLGNCQLAFDGRVLRYTNAGCDRLHY